MKCYNNTLNWECWLMNILVSVSKCLCMLIFFLANIFMTSFWNYHLKWRVFTFRMWFRNLLMFIFGYFYFRAFLLSSYSLSLYIKKLCFHNSFDICLLLWARLMPFLGTVNGQVLRKKYPQFGQLHNGVFMQQVYKLHTSLWN